MHETRIETVIRSYNLYNKGDFSIQIEFYRNLSSIDEVIEKTTLARRSDGKKHPHQYRLSQKVLNAVKSNLKKEKERILQCKDFDELRKLVNGSKVKGFGKLAVYDTAMRIGSFLFILPSKVYLHASTLKGAKALGLNTRKGFLEKNELPKLFQRLQPH